MENKVKDKGNVLMEGEVTGHMHRVSPKIKVMEREDGVRLFSGATEITHEEHKTITVPNMDYFSDRVQEYDYTRDMARKVID